MLYSLVQIYSQYCNVQTYFFYDLLRLLTRCFVDQSEKERFVLNNKGKSFIVSDSYVKKYIRKLLRRIISVVTVVAVAVGMVIAVATYLSVRNNDSANANNDSAKQYQNNVPVKVR